MTNLNTSHPMIEPFAIHSLKVSGLHTLYVEEIGNPQGVPVVFLHGGPGAGLQPSYRRFFDPESFHGILFAQRGSQPSSPLGEVRENDTALLVGDIETIRQYFDIGRWIVFGGSWGSTLALAYALQHPARVSALVLRGIFLGLDWELDWLYREGVSHIFPEAWQKFLAPIPGKERSNLVKAYHRRIFDPDPAIHQPAAWRWVQWEDSIAALLPGKSTPFTDESALAMARIECHYMVNRLFLPTNDYLLKEAHRLDSIPCHIVQGRYDMICPAQSALALTKEMPRSILHLVPDAGHSSSEPGIAGELIASMHAVNETLSKKDK